MTLEACTGQKIQRQIIIGGLLVLPLLIAGCHRNEQPAGQTIATVNGSDITTTDLRVELGSVPADQQKQVQARAVQSLVNREVLADYAKSQGMDRSADYAAQLRRMTKMLLAQRAAEQITASARQPITISQVNEYLDTHPDLANNRRLLLIDQYQFPSPSPAIAAELGQAKTAAELTAVLQRHGIQTVSTQVRLDTATIPDDVASKLDHLGPGEPLIVLSSPRATASIIADSKAAPLEGDAAEQLARERIASSRANAALQQRGVALRQEAKISYAKGFAPPAASKPAS